MLDKTKFTIKNTDKSVDKYIKTRMNPDIVINHLEKFKQLVIPGGFILDLGCGHGRDCKYFEDNGFNVMGIDLSRKMLKVARSVCEYTQLIHTDIRNINQLNCKFDGIWACASLYHLKKKDFIKLIDDIYNILNENGVLFIAIKQGIGEKIIYKEDLKVSKFYSLYSEEEILDILKNAGFNVIDVIIENKFDIWINIYSRKNG